MVSLWGSKKDNRHDEEGSAQQTDAPRESSDVNRREPDERTRLLPSRGPPPPRNDGYLDPDDPAVRSTILLPCIFND
jgi:hypothetical protein